MQLDVVGSLIQQIIKKFLDFFFLSNAYINTIKTFDNPTLILTGSLNQSNQLDHAYMVIFLRQSNLKRGKVKKFQQCIKNLISLFLKIRTYLRTSLNDDCISFSEVAFSKFNPRIVDSHYRQLKPKVEWVYSAVIFLKKQKKKRLFFTSVV